MLTTIVAMFIAIWGLPVSLPHPSPAQHIQERQQPTNQERTANPSVDKKEQQKADKQTEKKESGDNSIEKFLKLIREYNSEIVALSTVIMAFFTVGLFISTHLLWRSGEKHSERELRAYLSFSEAGIHNFGTAKPLKVILKIKNCGQTPAYEVRDWIQIAIQEFPYEEIDSATVVPTSSSLGPGDDASLIASLIEPLSQMQLSSIIGGDLAIYITCEVRYRDAFKVERVSRYRGFYRGNQAILDQAEILALNHARQGNKCT